MSSANPRMCRPSPRKRFGSEPASSGCRKGWKSLSEIPERVDLVDVFRKSADVPPIAEEAVRIGARFFWMQEGVESDRAREILDAAGIPWIMDRCVKKELAKRGK